MLPSEHPAPRPSPGLLAALTVALGTLFLLNEHDLPRLVGQGAERNEWDQAVYSPSLDETEAAIDSGSLARRVGYPALGLIGLGCLLARRRHVAPAHRPLAALGLAFVLWCAISVVWSDDPRLSLKRLIIFSAAVTGILGLRRVMALRDLAILTLAATGGFTLFSVLAELKLGLFMPWADGYRFAGLVHPNTQGAYCSLLCISTFFLMQGSSRPSWRVLLAVLVAGGALLVLTKSRASTIGCVAACGATWMMTAPRRRTATLLSVAPAAASGLLLAALLSGLASGDSLQEAATLGRQEEVAALSGRLPLWGHLLHYAAQRPLLGYGFDAFWSADRVRHVSKTLEWTIPNSHNVLLELQLNVGLLGTLLFLALAVTTLARAYREYRRSGDPMAGFAVALGISAAVSALFEASCSQPTGWDGFVTYAALWMAAAPRVARPAPRPRPRTTVAAMGQPRHRCDAAAAGN